MNELDKIKQAAEKARQDANKYEVKLFLQFIGSGLAVIVLVGFLAWLLGWI